MWKKKFQPRRMKGIPRVRLKRVLSLTTVLQEQRAPSLDWNRSEESRRDFFRKMETERTLDVCIMPNTFLKD